MQSTGLEIKSTPTLKSEWRRTVANAFELRDNAIPIANFIQKHPRLLAQ